MEGELSEVHVASLSIGNDPPIILDIEAPTFLILTEHDGSGTPVTTTIPFTFIVYDLNDISDLPDGTIGIITATGYYERTSNTPNGYSNQRSFVGGDCSYVDVVPDVSIFPGGFVGQGRRYSCDVQMFYYDDPSPWDIYITSFLDLDGNDITSGYSETGVFSPATTTGFFTSENALDFGTVRIIGFSPVPATIGGVPTPVKVFNTGNVVLDGTVGKTFEFTGSVLTGATDTSYTISAENFAVNIDNPADCSTATQQVDFVVGTPVAFTTLNINNGDNAISAHADKDIFFCMKTLTDSPLTVQAYSTGNGATPQDWIIGIG